MAAKTCLLSPDSGVDRKRVVEIANRALESAPTEPRYLQTVAIALYRAGQFDEAHHQFLASIEADSKDDSLGLHLVYCRLFLAMAEQRLNRFDDAQTSLSAALHGVQVMLENPDLRWDDRLILKLWREEAERVVAAGKTKNGGSTNKK